MRSTWLGLGLGLFTFIGCNALWQGYLSPLDDPSDGAVADLSDVDLTGEPPPDLIAADLTGVTPVDMAGPKPCGLTGTKSNVFSYSSYVTAINLGTLAASRVAVADIDKDGFAEVAVSTNSTPVKIYRFSGSTCTYNTTSADCSVNDAISDLKGFTIDPATNAGAFLVARSNASNIAISTCSGSVISSNGISDTNFSSTSTRRELTVPPLNSGTNGVFILHEKSNDPMIGDRAVSVKISSGGTLVSTVMLVNLKINGNFEPRNATGARIDDTQPDDILDLITLEVNGTSGQLKLYNNNHSTTPAASKGSFSLSGATFADANRITAARFTNDSFDDAVVINNQPTPPQIIPHIITAGGSVQSKAAININIPTASADRNKILFADLNNDKIDEIITISGNNISIFTYTAATNTLSAAQNIPLKAGYSAVAIALGYTEKSLSNNPPDIFVVANNGAMNEVGIFRWMP